jgi:ABC-type cobalamin/Fe3+-siderophores transport system ATPase subunit
VLVGENDAGKSVVLEAIEILVTGRVLLDEHRRDYGGAKAAETTLEGIFAVEELDTLPEEFRTGAGRNELRIFRRSSGVASELQVWQMGFENAEFDQFTGAERQKELLRGMGLIPGGNETQRKEQLKELINEGRLVRNTVRPVTLPNFSMLAGHMPRIQRIASNEYRTPDSMIQRALQQIAARLIAPPDADGNPREDTRLIEVRGEIVLRLNTEVDRITDVLRNVHPQIRRVAVNPSIDFARSVTATPLVVDLGEGDRPLTEFGEGTRKRMWLGLLDWEQQVARENAAGSTIRLYDEPDVNLHYAAQRQLFRVVSDLACSAEARTQCIICTHSVTLIDRAPCESVNLIQRLDDGQRALKRINPAAPDVMGFFNEVGQAVGLSNTALLYERGFLLLEGDSEMESLPMLYRQLWNRGTADDGLILVNLSTCSAWKAVMQVLLQNRQVLTHLLLDADCQAENSSARLTPLTLADVGCDAEFAQTHVTFVGEKEFEDAFQDEVIARGLNADFPREDGANWIEKLPDIRANAALGGKFSELVKEAVRTGCIRSRRADARKPKIARAIAGACITPDEIPLAIQSALTSLRHWAGLA